MPSSPGWSFKVEARAAEGSADQSAGLIFRQFSCGPDVGHSHNPIRNVRPAPGDVIPAGLDTGNLAEEPDRRITRNIHLHAVVHKFDIASLSKKQRTSTSCSGGILPSAACCAGLPLVCVGIDLGTPAESGIASGHDYIRPTFSRRKRRHLRTTYQNVTEWQLTSRRRHDKDLYQKYRREVLRKPEYPLVVIVTRTGEPNLARAVFHTPRTRVRILTTEQGKRRLSQSGSEALASVEVKALSDAEKGISPAAILTLLKRDAGVELLLHEAARHFLANFSQTGS
jgi:hypothetical protein